MTRIHSGRTPGAAPRKAVPKKKLFVASYGLTPVAQMTFESIDALRSCGVVYSGSVDAMTTKSVHGLGIPLVSLANPGPCGLLEKVLRAFKKNDRVGVLFYGNPLFLNQQMSELLHAVSRLAEVEVVPGVSSFDMLINLFGMTRLSEKGLFIADLNFFMEDPKFTPGPDIFFFAPFRLNAPDCGKFKAGFIKALSGKYARRFPAYLVKCDSNPARVEVIKGCMSCLPALMERCGKQHTLVIFSEGRLSSIDNPPPWLRFTARSVCDCDQRPAGPVRPARPSRQP
ncbi:MAG: hypothetical protein FD189_249 [Elusimicrobia bacterium]|nr:MAG: hypothetical protein FD154_49 [Elusimicrobiota bacterium]KAF0157982.1 MAG: hypothetical protein FD189_249 [Elusimicrobiota bacterium]